MYRPRRSTMQLRVWWVGGLKGLSDVGFSWGLGVWGFGVYCFKGFRGLGIRVSGCRVARGLGV